MTAKAHRTAPHGSRNDASARHVLLLDGLRGVAALTVVAAHFAERVGLTHLFPRGYLAVDFFFLLSGFVLAYAYGERLRTSLAASAYILRRLIRLLPILLPAAAIGAVIELGRPGAGLSAGHLQDIAIATVLSCMAIPLPFPTSMEQAIFPINGPVWSLFFELLASFVFVLVAKSPAPKAFALAITVVGGIGLTVWAWPYGVNLLGALLETWPGGFPRAFYAFFAGVVVFANRRRFPSLPAAIFPCALLAIFMMPRWLGGFDPAIDLITVFIVFPLLVGTASNSQPSQAFRAPCTLAGDLSYPLYALHYPLVRAMCAFMNRHDLSIAARLSAIAAGATLILGLAWAVLRFYDQPVRNALSRRLLEPRARNAGRTIVATGDVAISKR